jgi:hypothetical protein
MASFRRITTCPENPDFLGFGKASKGSKTQVLKVNRKRLNRPEKQV